VIRGQSTFLTRLHLSGMIGALFCLALSGFLNPPSTYAQERQKQVLVLYSTRRDTELPAIGDQEMARLISTGLGQSIDYYAEYFDLPRSSEPKYSDSFRDFLRVKYRNQRFDLIVAVQNVAINVLSRYRDELFPNAPVVFLAQDSSVERLRNSTGYLSKPDLTSTVALARKLQPDTRQVFVVTGASSRDLLRETHARTTAGHDPALTFTYLAGLTAPRLEQTLATLPEHSIIYYVLMYQDGAGENFNPIDYLDRIAGLANRPTYSWTESTMNHGVVGGTLRSQRAQIEALAGLALRVLRREPADSIPLTELKLGENEVDWRQLQRWHISETDVPPGTRILFRDADLWHEYKARIIGATALLVVQAALIAFLLVQRAKRKQAQQQAAKSHAEALASYEQVRDLGARPLNAQAPDECRIRQGEEYGS
jgi:hypothetical protein